ncbi:hypothetical protein Leryth_005557 [Lithospermum erythrorhizon]|nr:hypothetical protein Leryth_005557 [Lithospermum erythrorhizon]
MSRAAAGVKGGKKKGVSFVIDCAKPVEDKIMDIASLEKFLQERIKVGGKPALIDAMRHRDKSQRSRYGAAFSHTIAGSSFQNIRGQKLAIWYNSILPIQIMPLRPYAAAPVQAVTGATFCCLAALYFFLVINLD